MRYGINFHPIKKPASDDQRQFDLMRQRGLTTARLDLPMAADTDATLVPRLQGLVTLAKYNDMTLLPILCTPFTWGDIYDNGQYTGMTRANALYAQGYNRTKALVTIFRNDIRDWEMGNEINLLMHDASGSPLFGKGWYPTEYSGAVMDDWAQVLKGQSDAIQWVNTTYGTSLRRVLNTTGTMFGFLDFMASKGVHFEVLDYHSYEYKGYDPKVQWANYVNTSGVQVNSFNLYQKLAMYGRPVVIGEINAAEIYRPTYTNVEGNADTEDGYVSLRGLLKAAADQTNCTVEAVYLYELLDDPTYVGSPECRFGLYCTPDVSKVSSLLVANRAGAVLTSGELARLTSRNLQSL